MCIIMNTLNTMPQSMCILIWHEAVKTYWLIKLEETYQHFCKTLWLRTIYHQTKFGCKRLISSEEIVETVLFLIYMNLHCNLDLEDGHPVLCCWLRHSGLIMMMNHHTKFSYKRLSSSEDIIWTNWHYDFSIHHKLHYREHDNLFLLTEN